MLPRACRLVVEVASPPHAFWGYHVYTLSGGCCSGVRPLPLRSPSEIPRRADRQLGQVVAGPERRRHHSAGLRRHHQRLASGAERQAPSEHPYRSPYPTPDGAAAQRRSRQQPQDAPPRPDGDCFTMGSQALYDFIDDNPAFLHKTLSYTNNPSVLAAPSGHDLHQRCTPDRLDRSVRLRRAGHPAHLRQRRPRTRRWAPR